MASRTRGDLPDNIKDLPIQVQLAVLYERVQNLTEDVVSLRRTLQVFIGAIVSGAVIFLFSIAQGWIGNTKSSTAIGLLKAVRHLW